MKILKLLASITFPLAFMLGTAQADDDVTMSVIEEGETVDRVLAPIELPKPEAIEGTTNSEKGRSTAEEARKDGSEFGAERAAEARERGEQARETANENAENARDRMKDDVGRGALDNIPDNVRDNLPEEVERRRPPPPPPRGGG